MFGQQRLVDEAAALFVLFAKGKIAFIAIVEHAHGTKGIIATIDFASG
jgi:hypothetical protein